MMDYLGLHSSLDQNQQKQLKQNQFEGAENYKNKQDSSG